MTYLLVLMLAVLQVGDWLTTHIVISQGGHEENPLIEKMIDMLGFDAALALKGVFVVLIGLIMELIMPGSSLTLVLYYSVIAYHNWKQIK